MYGACPECTGWADKYDFDPAKVINDWSKPLLDGGLGPGSASQNLIHMLQISAASLCIDLNTPFEKFFREDARFSLTASRGVAGRLVFTASSDI